MRNQKPSEFTPEQQAEIKRIVAEALITAVPVIINGVSCYDPRHTRRRVR